ncbi:diaminopimelate decarboxylase [Flammeovirgaceae bacterium 311]|nr:diaminopimelate decarboxylase [Flammeovirgaceae bacterium 311]
MDFFHTKNNELFCEEVAVQEIVSKVGTPCYIYSANTLREHYKKLRTAFSALNPLICFSIKTCNNIHLIQELVKEGSGMDTVSGGEIFLALKANTPPAKIVFAGIGKSDQEISYALEQGVGIFNIESEAEFENISRIAASKKVKVRAALRVTPDVVDEKTHSKTKTGYRGSKFGVDLERAKTFFATYGGDPFVKVTGIHIHIGSPIYSPKPYEIAITKITALIDELEEQGHTINIIDIGGGYSADYETGKSASYDDFAAVIVPLLKPYADRGAQIIMEPGRTISGNAGILATQVNYLKKGGDKTFAIVDTGMHHLIRPALYDAQHFIWPIKTSYSPQENPDNRIIDQDNPRLVKYDVVGPICESSDYLARDRNLPPLQRGDIIAIFTSGAYGMVMSSNYNALPRPAEVMIDGDEVFLIRERETYEDLLRGTGKVKLD